MTTLQKNAGALATQTDAAGVGRHAALIHLQFTHPLLLLLAELLQHVALLPAALVVLVAPPQDEEQRGTGGDAEHNGQDPPQPDAVALLPEEGVVVQPAQEVAEALLGRLQLNKVVVEDQLADASHTVAHTQHLLGFVDAFGSFPTQEVADDAGQGLDRGVKVLVGGLQVQIHSV